MGGSTERGNHTPTAEFNTFADPEALDVVLTSGCPCGWWGSTSPTRRWPPLRSCERLRDMDHVWDAPRAEWMGFFGSSYRRIWQFDSPPVHDPCTIAALIHPELSSWARSFVAVETQGQWTRGTTVVDLHHRYRSASRTARWPSAWTSTATGTSCWPRWTLGWGVIASRMTGCCAWSAHQRGHHPAAYDPAGSGADRSRTGRARHGGKGANQAVAAASQGSAVTSSPLLATTTKAVPA